MAQSAQQEALVDALLWIAVVVFVVFLAMLILSYIRRRVDGTPQAGRIAFTPEQLKRLRDQGNLTVSEYEALKRKVLQG